MLCAVSILIFFCWSSSFKSGMISITNYSGLVIACATLERERGIFVRRDGKFRLLLYNGPNFLALLFHSGRSTLNFFGVTNFSSLITCLYRGGFIALLVSVFCIGSSNPKSSRPLSRVSVLMLTGKGFNFDAFGFLTSLSFNKESLGSVYSDSRVAKSLISFSRTGLYSEVAMKAASLISLSSRLFTS